MAASPRRGSCGPKGTRWTRCTVPTSRWPARAASPRRSGGCSSPLAGRLSARRSAAEAILLGGTDLFLAFVGEDCGFPTLDCADVHVESAVPVVGCGSAGVIDPASWGRSVSSGCIRSPICGRRRSRTAIFSVAEPANGCRSEKHAVEAALASAPDIGVGRWRNKFPAQPSARTTRNALATLGPSRSSVPATMRMTSATVTPPRDVWPRAWRGIER